MSIILAIDGPEGSGKTSLALSAYEVAPPVTLLDLDGNGWIALRKFQKQVQEGLICMKLMEDLGEDDPGKAQKAWNWFRKEAEEALSRPGTLVVDTAGMLWHLDRLIKLEGYLGGNRINTQTYEQANHWMDGFFYRFARSTETNLVLIHRAEHPWVVVKVGEKTEMGYDERLWRRARAYKHTGFAVHTAILVTKTVTSPTVEQKKKAAEAGRKEPKTSVLFSATFTENRFDEELVNTVVVNPTFKKLWERMFPQEEE